MKCISFVIKLNLHHTVSTIKTKQLKLFKEVINIYFENRNKGINLGEVQVITFTADGIYSYQYF